MMVFLFLVVIGLYLFYKWGRSTFDFFQRQGIVFRKPIAFLGTSSNFVLNRKPFMDILDDWYNEFKHEKCVFTPT